MAISTMLIRMQIALFKPFVNWCNIDTSRLAQKKMGELMVRTHRAKVSFSSKIFDNFVGEWIIPKKQKFEGIILYLHGGGFVSGDIEYAKGFGAIISAKNGIRVFCAAYRLAPEYTFPAALDDALEAYKYLLNSGYSSDKILLCGESAGGGLIYSLTLELKKQSLPLPCGLIAISPWSDLTLSGESHNINIKNDPSLTKERLGYYASLYASDTTNPLVSPLFGDLTLFPSSLIFVGGSEILLDDSVSLHKKLIECGSRSELIITPEMWHAYILYGIKESKNDHIKISEFIVETLHEATQIEMDAT